MYVVICDVDSSNDTKKMTDKEGETTRSTGYSKQIVEEILQKSGVQRESTSGHETRLELQYLPYDMFDLQGTRKLAPTLMKLHQWPTWYFPIHWTNSSIKLSSFMFCYRLDIHPRFYTSVRLKYPLSLEMTTDYVKRTSKRFTVHLKERENPNPLSTTSWIEVNVDPVTKRPSPFPSLWKQKFKFPTDGPALDIKTPTKPETGVILTHRKVHFLDTDANNHTSFPAYVMYCLDAFYENVLHGKYREGCECFLNGWMKSMDVVFKGEASVGDVLTIESWGDSGCRDMFHCEVTLEGNAIVTVTFTFYASLVESSHL